MKDLESNFQKPKKIVWHLSLFLHKLKIFFFMRFFSPKFQKKLTGKFTHLKRRKVFKNICFQFNFYRSLAHFLHEKISKENLPRTRITPNGYFNVIMCLFMIIWFILQSNAVFWYFLCWFCNIVALYKKMSLLCPLLPIIQEKINKLLWSTPRWKKNFMFYLLVYNSFYLMYEKNDLCTLLYWTWLIKRSILS